MLPIIDPAHAAIPVGQIADLAESRPEDRRGAQVNIAPLAGQQDLHGGRSLWPGRSRVQQLLFRESLGEPKQLGKQRQTLIGHGHLGIDFPYRPIV